VRHEGMAATVRFAGIELRVPAPRVDGNAGNLVVRSAAVSLTEANGAPQALPATIRKATYLGGHWEYTLETAFGALFLSQPVGKRFEQGSTVAVHLDPQHLSVVARAE